MSKPKPMSTRERVARRRQALRAQGLRPKQIWVPDLRSPEVRERIRAECEAINRADSRSDDMQFLDSISIFNDLSDDDIPEHR
jgi:hypothetical protein